ncbi:hypothetical protein NYR30_04435 [Gallibacterium salpingitidis]|uniref:baseplate hub protein n=1 Tax=Gallibacterium salpingitidis TaxID=505341 RepID=UPI00266F4122|nr:hypothetical protein [Gallibacterium salpingitidis]WKT00541.1 hypothetical protein NYR30_04435 [Gallibacterium salpingitidis]
MSFNKKRLKVTLYLGEKGKSFDDNGKNTVVLENFRVSAMVQSGNGSGASPTAKIMIWGLGKNIINQVTKIHWNTEQSQLNSIKLEADNGDGVYHVVYQGTISFAYPNFGSAPEHILTIDSVTALNHQVLPTQPTSHNGSADVADMIKTLCDSMGMKFENNGVNIKLSNPYLPQTALEKVRQICESANISMYLDKDTIAIALKDQPRKTKIAVLSPNTGLIGYPVPNLQGITLKALYDQSVIFGGLIEIKDSQIEMANGQWRVFGITYYLESELPSGRWEMEIQAASPTGGARIAK